MKKARQETGRNGLGRSGKCEENGNGNLSVYVWFKGIFHGPHQDEIKVNLRLILDYVCESPSRRLITGTPWDDHYCVKVVDAGV